MLLAVLRCLACLMLVFTTLSASAKPRHRPPAETIELDEEPARGAADDSSDDDEGGSSNGGVGIECAPAISEVETRRQIPFSCSVTKDAIERVEIRYKAPGRRKWTKIHLRKSGDEYTGDIPCNALTKRGTLKLSVVGLDSKKKTVARIGGVKIQVVDSSDQPPPALPGREPPMRCFDPHECPPELLGSPACPGTKAKGGMKGWGASCENASECQKGLDCVAGTCEKPAKCDSSAECDDGECVDGTCHYLDAEERASRLGPPKRNWIGLHFGADFIKMGAARGVCGSSGDDAKNYDCYAGSERFGGPPNATYGGGGTVNSGFGLGTMRILASYDRWFGRAAAGVRLGFAFGGAPKDFFPVHAELRLIYSLVGEPLTKRFRPYLGIAGGLARVDSHAKVIVADCHNAGNPTACEEETDPSQLPSYGVTRGTSLDAYRLGDKLFFGPTIGFIFALSNEAAISTNLNVMLRSELVFEPSIGYMMGL